MKNENIIISTTLSESFLFRGVDMQKITPVIESGGVHINNYNAGDIIYEPTVYERSLGIIISGGAFVTTASGEKRVSLRTLKKGDVFGAASMFGGEEYVTRIFAKSKCAVVFVSQEQIEEFIKTDSEIALNYIAFLSDKIRFLNKKIASFTAGTAESRLAGYIMRLIGENENKTEITLPLAIKPLAEELDIGRASLYRAFGVLEKTGCVKRAERIIYILSKSELEKFL